MQQVWFTLKVIPPIPLETIKLNLKAGENFMFPIGNIVNGRQLAWCMTEDFERIRTELEKYAKQVTVCGMSDVNGKSHKDYAKNKIEYDKHLQKVIKNGEEEIPVGLVGAGWFDFDYEPEVTNI